MPNYCGELKQLASPSGGGYITTRTEYTDGSISHASIKNRMIFPLIRIGDSELEGVISANDRLGSEIAANLVVGDDVCLVTFSHLLRKQIVIGARAGDGRWYCMPRRGYFTAMLLYTVFMPVILGIPGAIIGMLVGMLAGREGSALGLLLGLLGAVGISWLTAWRMHSAYLLMSSTMRENKRG